MKKTPKSAIPPRLNTYLTATPNNTWEQFTEKKGRRIAVQTVLKGDQGGLCAYCEINMKARDSTGDADFRVEHFHPKSDASTPHNWHLDWQNLLAVCHGGSSKDVVEATTRFTTLHSCDVPKENHVWDNVILNPLHIPANPCLFKFDRSTGAMGVNEQRCAQVNIDLIKAQATIDNLQLDSSRLRNLRKPVMDVLNAKLISLVNSGVSLVKAREALAITLLKKDAQHHWPPFFSAIRHYLGDAAEQQLQAIGYDG